MTAASCLSPHRNGAQGAWHRVSGCSQPRTSHRLPTLSSPWGMLGNEEPVTRGSAGGCGWMGEKDQAGARRHWFCRVGTARGRPPAALSQNAPVPCGHHGHHLGVRVLLQSHSRSLPRKPASSLSRPGQHLTSAVMSPTALARRLLFVGCAPVPSVASSPSRRAPAPSSRLPRALAHGPCFPPRAGCLLGARAPTLAAAWLLGLGWGHSK